MYHHQEVAVDKQALILVHLRQVGINSAAVKVVHRPDRVNNQVSCRLISSDNSLRHIEYQCRLV